MCAVYMYVHVCLPHAISNIYTITILCPASSGSSMSEYLVPPATLTGAFVCTYGHGSCNQNYNCMTTHCNLHVHVYTQYYYIYCVIPKIATTTIFVHVLQMKTGSHCFKVSGRPKKYNYIQHQAEDYNYSLLHTPNVQVLLEALHM